jgi:hypothetical protein
MTIRAFSQADFCKNLLNRSKRPLFLYSDHDAACKMTIRPKNTTLKVSDKKCIFAASFNKTER